MSLNIASLGPTSIGQHVWDTRQVPAGVYSVELLNNGLRVETKRLVVQPQN